jgi:cytochrome c oxidase assembly factor CtaG
MRKRINLLALLVIAAGAAVFARPAPAEATYYNPWQPPSSCCVARDAYGSVISQCCSAGGCMVTAGKCIPWS